MSVSTIKDEKTGIMFITVEQPDMTVTFSDFGARIHNWLVPNQYGIKENIVLTIDNPADIITDSAQFGALVGPVAGRITQGIWQDVQLEKNLGPHHIHGGNQGWWHQFWDVSIEAAEDRVLIHFLLNDTTSGYPGPISIKNTYEVTTNSIIMTTTCVSKSDTIVNPTNHVYFNLSGDVKEDISNHLLSISADFIIETNLENLPTGKLTAIAGTGYDFNEETKIQDGIDLIGKGIDDAFILKKEQLPISLIHPASKRKLTISTNRQAVVVFTTTDFNLDCSVNGTSMSSQLGIALETQELPDIVNFPHWGNIDLLKGEVREFKTTYTLSNYE